ncbi:uncharacterized protein LOC113273199 [Papaver somniferum]|uniref:uncharacterized protein LOC113273199 n=1 Tax=Papaver somniferum TaxID=3469 RepID=UPI000E6F7106|nr:uncharacterized protein LOC113273199 [Papaver somniferum]
MDVASPVEKADDIAKKIIRPQFQTEIPKWVARHARRLVLAERDGTFETCYKKTPQLVIAATSLNPRSIGHFSWSKDDKDNRFESLILAYNAQIKGFMNGCIMVIGLDGAHLTGKFGGVMLSATCIDAQNGVFPLCMMICMGETEENWFMMLKELRKRIPDMAGLTFISDRMKGILESVKRLYPLSNHRYCLRHLYKNFLTKGFRNPRPVQLLWQAAKAYKYHHWEEAMQEIAEISPDAYKYLIDAEPKSWARSWFPHDVACEHIYSNFSESFNNMALKFRGKPLTQLVDMYTHLVMVLFSNRRKLAGDLVPAGKDLIKVMCDLRGNYECDPSVEHKVYEVTNKATGKVFVVKVEEKKCTCRQWQLRQFPCLHGVVALFKLNPNWSKYCSKYYTVDYSRTAYQWSITPLGNIDEYQNKCSNFLREMSQKAIMLFFDAKHEVVVSKICGSFKKIEKQVGLKFRHDLVRDVIVDICYKAGVPVRKEVFLGFLSDNDKNLRPADILILNWENGEDVCTDVIGVSPFTGEGVRVFSHGFSLCILAFSTLGEIGEDTLCSSKRLKNYLVTNDTSSGLG